MKSTIKIFILGLVLVLSAPLYQDAKASNIMDINFDLNPKVITFPTTNVTYTIRLTTQDEPGLRAACGNGNIRAYIYIAGKEEFFKETDFLANPTQTKTGTFIAEAHNNTSVTYTVNVSCGSTALTSTNLTLPVTGQPAGAVGVNFDASPNTLAPNATATFNFKLAFSGSQSYLDSKCGPGNMVWNVYKLISQSGTGVEQLIPANEIKRGAVANSTFGSGQTVEQNFSLSVTSPGKNFYFKAQATCPDGKVLTTSGPAPAGGVTSGGTGGGGGGGGGTSSQSYTFEIPNPIAGGANTITDLINVITTWIFNLSIPIAVVFILYAGFLYLTAGPNPANVGKAKKILTQVVIGLAIIFIGKGFITLIKSIIELGTGG